MFGRSIFVSIGSKKRKNGVLNVVDFDILSSFEKIESSQSDLRGLLTTSTILYGVGGFLGILISLFSIPWMCLI